MGAMIGEKVSSTSQTDQPVQIVGLMILHDRPAAVRNSAIWSRIYVAGSVASISLGYENSRDCRRNPDHSSTMLLASTEVAHTGEKKNYGSGIG